MDGKIMTLGEIEKLRKETVSKSLESIANETGAEFDWLVDVYNELACEMIFNKLGRADLWTHLKWLAKNKAAKDNDEIVEVDYEITIRHSYYAELLWKAKKYDRIMDYIHELGGEKG